MREINGRKYSNEELRAIYKFFLEEPSWRDHILLPSYNILREIGFEEDSDECRDLASSYEQLSMFDRIMHETHGKASELALVYGYFKRCLPRFLDDDGEPVATCYGWKLKELEDCNDQEIVNAIQRMYDKYMESKHESFMESLENIIA